MELSVDTILGTWLPLLLAGLVQASFGLSVSLLTLLGGHALSRRESARRLVGLSWHFVFGVMLAVAGLLLAALYLFQADGSAYTTSIWALLVGLTGGVGVVIALFYYRRGSGTSLWLPRFASQFLLSRTERTKNVFEALLLGVGSVLIELVFVAPPVLVAGHLLSEIGQPAQLIGLVSYILLASSSVIVMAVLIGSGHRISRLQAWRERNKRFLQVAAGICLIALAAYLFVYKVIEVAA
jgi:hypothetical protein